MDGRGWGSLFYKSVVGTPSASTYQKTLLVLPLRCRDIATCDSVSECFNIAGQQFHQVSLVAKVVSGCSMENCSSLYQQFHVVDDVDEATVLVRSVLSDERDRSYFTPGSIVRIYGRLKGMLNSSGGCYISAFRVLSASNDEFLCHAHETLLAKLYYEKDVGSRVSADAMKWNKTVSTCSSFGASDVGGPAGEGCSTAIAMSMPAPLPLPGPATAAIGDNLCASIHALSAVDRKILHMMGLHEDDGDDGVSISSLMEFMDGALTADEIAARIDILAQEGYVYSTDGELQYRVLK